MVHHGEHALQAVTLAADQLCLGSVKGQLAGRLGVDTHLLFDARDNNRVARAVVFMRATQKERKPTQPVIRRACQNKVKDTLAQILIAARNEDLLAGDFPDVTVLLGPATDTRKVRTCARLGQGHGRQPLTGSNFWQSCLLLRVRAVRHQSFHSARCKTSQHLHRVIGPGIDFRGQGKLDLAQTLAIVFLGHDQTGPALFAESLIGRVEFLGHLHPAIDQIRALFIPDDIDRRQFAFGEGCKVGTDLG